MSNAVPYMSTSLDGFVAGPNVSTEQPMGEGAGASIHDWMVSRTWLACRSHRPHVNGTTEWTRE
jgi:hypothetical protein